MSELHSSKPASQRKPERPEGSPLFWHASGRWAKKIRGKLHYFGRGTHAEALEAYDRDKADLHAGRQPAEEMGRLTVYQLFVKFLGAKKAQRDNGELAPRSFVEYGMACKLMQRTFGKSRLVSDIRPEDWANLRAAMAKKWGPVRLKTEVVRCRTPFNWGAKMGLLERAMVFGDSFRIPTAKTIRTHRVKQGQKMFEAAEIRRMLVAAGQPMKAMILLAVNCGYGNHDVATLPISALDLDGGWVKHARPKTGIGRRCPLWPETIQALREWLTIRPQPKKAEHVDVVFITYKKGSWLDNEVNRSLSQATRLLLNGLNIEGHRGFYCLRHTHQTIGDESGDFLAVRKLMGHAVSNDIGDVYRERVSDERLRRVVNHIHDWLFTVEDENDGEGQPKVIPFTAAHVQ